MVLLLAIREIVGERVCSTTWPPAKEWGPYDAWGAHPGLVVADAPKQQCSPFVRHHGERCPLPWGHASLLHPLPLRVRQQRMGWA